MFSVILEGIKKEAGRSFSELAEARARVPELAPYATAVDLVAAMTAPSFVSSDRAAPLVAALVVEAQRSRSRDPIHRPAPPMCDPKWDASGIRMGSRLS